MGRNILTDTFVLYKNKKKVIDAKIEPLFS